MSKSSPHGISLHVTITVAPSDVDAFLAALKPCYEAVTAELECTYFEVYHNPANPGELRFVENWSQSKEWFVEVSIALPYRQKARLDCSALTERVR